jgi:hypothetical protein
MKRIITMALFFGGLVQTTNAQNDPVMDAIYLSDADPFCYNGSGKTLTVVVTDIDGDAVSINYPTYTNNYLEGFNPMTSVVGNTTTYVFPISINYITPPPAGVLSLEDLQVTATTSNGLDPTMAVNGSLSGIEVNGQIDVLFSTTLLEICNTGNPIDLTQYVVTPGGTFNTLLTPTPYTYSDAPFLNPSAAYNVYIADDYSYSVEYSLVDLPSGCIGTGYLPVSFWESPSITMTVTPSVCLGATGTASAEINGFGSPFEVYWTTGFSESTGGISAISNLSSGVYYANVTDANGCKNVAKANISDSDILVTPTFTDVRCAGQPGSIALSIMPSSGTVDEILWSNGTTTPTISSGPGEYSVSIHTTANCNFFGTYTILDSALKVKLDDYYANTNCLSAPNGEFYITTTGGIGAYAWDWKKGGTTVWTQEDLLAADGGLYTCTVSDGNGCSLTWAKTLENYNNVYLWTEEVQHPTCGNSDGSIDITIDNLWDTPAFYEWSNGSTSEDLTGLAAGNYTLTYTDQAGCTNYLTVKLMNQRPYQPTICLLTVDTSLIYNMVVWEKDITQDVTAFNIYRETSVFGQFEKIVTRPYALESFFQDNDASPVDRSWRYYITTVDACGTESYGSFVHKTIHVVSNTSNGTDYNISWDDYEGISYTSIDLFRHDDVNGWEIAANLPYGTNTYLEAPSVLSGLDYMVSFNLTDSCTSTKAQDHNSTRSNKTASVFNGGGSTAEIHDEDLGLISIYPNPASEMLTLHVDNAELFQYYEVTDLNGKVVSTGTIMTNNTNIDLFSMEAGVYLIRLVSDEKIVVNKFVKN